MLTLISICPSKMREIHSLQRSNILKKFSCGTAPSPILGRGYGALRQTSPPSALAPLETFSPSIVSSASPLSKCSAGAYDVDYFTVTRMT